MGKHCPLACPLPSGVPAGIYILEIRKCNTPRRDLDKTEKTCIHCYIMLHWQETACSNRVRNYIHFGENPVY